MSHIATVAECTGCGRMTKRGACKVYLNPSYWWRDGRYCPMATHLQNAKALEQSKIRVGQQKQRKKK